VIKVDSGAEALCRVCANCACGHQIRYIFPLTLQLHQLMKLFQLSRSVLFLWRWF